MHCLNKTFHLYMYFLSPERMKENGLFCTSPPLVTYLPTQRVDEMFGALLLLEKFYPHR